MKNIHIFIILVLIIALLFLPRQIIGGSTSKKNIQNIQNKVYDKYKYLIPKGKMSFSQFCYPEKYSIQPQQIFAGMFMAPSSKPKEILIYHKIGAGKTCLSIQIAEKWKHLGKPLIVMPASLIPGFRNELRSKCAGNNYLHGDPNDITPEQLEESNKLIDKYYNILSYNKFLTNAPSAPIIIVDEIQNLNNVKGKYFLALLKWINKHNNASVVIMSGTPLFDSPNELIGLSKLLRSPLDENVDVINDLSTIKKSFFGKVSYFAGAPSFTFPKTTIKIKQCLMSKFQHKWYISEVETELSKNKNNLIFNKISNDFYIKTRQRSNVVYPKGLVGKNGMELLTTNQIINKLQTYSTKMFEIMKKLRKRELSFIYSNFTEYGGIKFIERVLDANGYKNFKTYGPGLYRYAIWSGDQTLSDKDEIRSIFNSYQNDDASQLQIVIGSPSIKEGVTLLRVRQVHVLESYWNHSKLEQIFGRAVRYCSHKTLPKSKRTVNIYIYAAVTKKIKYDDIESIDANTSIDLYMLKMADMKKHICSKYLKLLIDSAVDKYLWQKK